VLSEEWVEKYQSRLKPKKYNQVQYKWL
jgi:hypothetical protein